MSRNGSYPYYFLNDFYKSLNNEFPLFLTQLTATLRENWILYFYLREGKISSKNKSTATVSKKRKGTMIFKITHKHSYYPEKYIT